MFVFYQRFLIDLINNAENIRNYCGQIISLMTERFVFFIKDSRRHIRLDGCSLQIVFKFWIEHCCIVSFWRHVMIKWTSWMVVLHISLNLPRHGSPWVFAWRWTLSLSALKKNAGKLIVKQGLVIRRVGCCNACVQTSEVGRVGFELCIWSLSKKGILEEAVFSLFWSSLSRMVWVIWRSDSFQLGWLTFHVSGECFRACSRGDWQRKVFDWHSTLN